MARPYSEVWDGIAISTPDNQRHAASEWPIPGFMIVGRVKA